MTERVDKTRGVESDMCNHEIEDTVGVNRETYQTSQGIHPLDQPFWNLKN